MECLYRQGMSSKTQMVKCEKESDEIISLYPDDIKYYQVALIYKFSGLMKLANGRIQEGLEQLEASCRFLEKSFNPMFYLLSASVRAYRALHFLGLEQLEAARIDIDMIFRQLQVQKDIKAFFKDKIQRLASISRIRKPNSPKIEETRSALERIIEKIPY